MLFTYYFFYLQFIIHKTRMYIGIDVMERYSDYTSGSKQPVDWAALKENRHNWDSIWIFLQNCAILKSTI